MRSIRLDGDIFGNALYALSVLLFADGILMALLLAGSLPFDRVALLELHAAITLLVFVAAAAALLHFTLPNRIRPVLSMLALALLIAFNPFYPLLLTAANALAASLSAAISSLALAHSRRS